MSTTRLAAARTAYDDAVRAERLARIAAAPELRARARRRRAGLRLLGAASLILAVVLVVVGVVMAFTGAAEQRGLDADRAARDAAVGAVTVMLSADPAHPDAYVDRVLGVSTGAQHERVSQARVALREAVAGFGAPSTGHVIAAGVQGSGDAAVIPVLVVAQASAPELVGGVPGAGNEVSGPQSPGAGNEVSGPQSPGAGSQVSERVAVRVLMARDGDRWLVQDTELVS